MTGLFVLLLTLGGSALAGDPALLVERGEAATAMERWVQARSLAMEALEEDPTHTPAWRLYLRASQGAGLGPMARAEVITREGDQPALAVAQVAERVQAGKAPLSELEAVVKENPGVGRLVLAEVAWEREEHALARQLVAGSESGRRATLLQLRFAVAAGDVATANAVARTWLRTHPESPDLLVELWPVGTAVDLALLQKRMLKRLRKEQADRWDDALWLYRATEVFAAAEAHADARALADRIEQLGYEPPLHRRPWSPGMVEGMGRVLAKRDGSRGIEGSASEQLALTRSRVNRLRRAEDFDGAIEAWEALRKERDSSEAALAHARLLQVLERYAEALDVALEARGLAAGPVPDDLGCLNTALHAARLADAHGLIAELALSQGRLRTATEAVAVARALDPHPRWIALEAQLKVIPEGSAADRGLPSVPRVQAVVDTLVDPTLSERWVARAQRHADAGETQAAFVAWVVARAYGASIGDALARSWDGMGPVDEAAQATLEAYHSARREHRSILAEIRAEGSGEAPILPTAVAPGPGVMLPAWEATAIDGEVLSSEILRGQPYILSIWATWCLPCLQELPALNREVAKELDRGEDVLAVAISVDDRETVYQRTADAEGWSALILGWNPDLSATLGVDGLPTNFAVDGEGRIVHLERGYSQRGVSRLLEAVRDLED